DLRRFYPGAGSYHSERLTLSSHVIALTRRLGRRPAAGELSLDRYAIEPAAQGRVLIRRVRGEYGAVELLLALDSGGKVRGLRLPIRNLLRRPARLTLTLVGLAVSVALSMSLLAFADGYQANLRHDLDRAGIQLMLVPLGCPYDAAARALKGRVLEASLPASV